MNLPNWLHFFQRPFPSANMVLIEGERPLLEEMLPARAAEWRDGRVVALAPHTPPSPGWLASKVMPGEWPRLAQAGKEPA